MARNDSELDEERVSKTSIFLSWFSHQLHRTNYADNFLNAIGQHSSEPAAVFMDSMTVLLSSSHPSIVRNTLSFIANYLQVCLPLNHLALVSSKLIPRILSTPHFRDLSVLAEQKVLSSIFSIFRLSVGLAQPHSVQALSPDAGPQSIRNVVLHEVMIPIEPSLVQISRNHSLSSWIDQSAEPLALLVKIFEVSAFDQPTLDYICSSHIPMVFQSLFSKVEDDWLHQSIIYYTSDLVNEWRTDGTETMRRGRILFLTLERGGFRDHLEQILLHDKASINGRRMMFYSFRIMNTLGVNSLLPE
ncbi:hypothetical protein BLNAU_13652 [Blattamonas nauphoetae]|uniref:Uncharacterized protein n=1 Tax=Blattamonas nauphoetae TaxID=2049346 RepID=A0ABQ9XL71_9EUKA|nr:hypothetical protein BLNAU_13652 [Blattamonas nauphoetae]